MPGLIQIGLLPVVAPHLADAEVLAAVLRSTRRRAEIVHAEMRRGMSGLATVASTASFLGLLLTCYEIINSFRGVNGEKTTAMANLIMNLSEALIPTVFGLAVAILALIMYHLFSAWLSRLQEIWI